MLFHCNPPTLFTYASLNPCRELFMRNNLLQIAILSLLFLGFNGSHEGQFRLPETFVPASRQMPPYYQENTRWVDSIMESLSLEEQIAQMIMIWAYSNQGPEHERSVLRQISKDKVGGILFFQGEPLKQARLTNRYQEASEVPLLIAMDGENGPGMRLRNTMTYPSMMTLGAIGDNQLIYTMGQDVASQFKRLGVQMNFAPVADINNNRFNPVIGTRSFGEQRENVAEKVVAYMQGMQEGRLLVAAKHFPGHGDTGSDSHHSLPVIPYDMQRLDSLELYPFREAIDRGLTGIMVAHLQVPALDSREQRPTTLSRPTITGLLREQMGFTGLIITDALNMKGISEFYGVGEREVEAVKAGNDILLMPSDVGKAIQEVKRAVKNGEIPEEQIRQSCRKILQAKYWTGLAERRPVETASLIEEMNLPVYKKHYRELVEHSLTLVRNRENLLPLSGLEQLRMATVTITPEKEWGVGEITDLYLEGDHFLLAPDDPRTAYDEVVRELNRYNTIVVNVWNTSTRASRGYGISDETIRLVDRLDTTASLILNVAGVPYALTRFPRLDQMDAILLTYEDDPLYQQKAMQAIFGGISLSGRLPVSAGRLARAGTGVFTGPPVRLGYGEPEDVGLDPDTLQRMEGIIYRAIRDRAIPGCQLLVARRGKIVWQKGYGYHTYQKRKAVQPDDLYDLASVTKIAATTAALMRLRDQGKFHEDSLLGSYGLVPETCDKTGLRIGDILSHQAGLEPWIPFHYRTLEPLDTSQHLISRRFSYNYPFKLGPGAYANRNVRYADGFYASTFSPEFPYQVADHLFVCRGIRDSILHWICQSELLSPEYRYSDLGFFLFHQIIEAQSDTALYPYVWYNFYAPMGATTLGYNPLSRFPAERIVPTENDLFYRKQLLQGYVQDAGAALLGGVCGNAGLFGCANDLAKMMQMYLNGGWYGERRFIEAATLQKYTSCYNRDESINRRGLGFDRSVVDEPGEGPACDSASPQSYGHSGYTGTLAWVDPAEELVFVFLSNRVHPNQGNYKLISENIRTVVQQVVYDAITDE